MCSYVISICWCWCTARTELTPTMNQQANSSFPLEADVAVRVLKTLLSHDILYTTYTAFNGRAGPTNQLVLSIFYSVPGSVRRDAQYRLHFAFQWVCSDHLPHALQLKGESRVEWMQSENNCSFIYFTVIVLFFFPPVWKVIWQMCDPLIFLCIYLFIYFLNS